MGDRSTYRMYGDARLIEEAKYDPNRELAIVLGERLDDVIRTSEAEIEEQIERARDFELDANKLDLQIEDLENKIDELELMLSQREGFIEELQREIAQLKKEDC